MARCSSRSENGRAQARRRSRARRETVDVDGRFSVARRLAAHALDLPPHDVERSLEGRRVVDVQAHPHWRDEELTDGGAGGAGRGAAMTLVDGNVAPAEDTTAAVGDDPLDHPLGVRALVVVRWQEDHANAVRPGFWQADAD